MEFKINIGTRFKDDKRDLIVLDKELRKDKKGRYWKWYRYKCNKCGFDDGWNIEHHILNGVGCSCCRGFTVIKGINDVATTHPEYIKYFFNVEDAYSTTFSSKKKVLMKCPRCGTPKEIEMTQFHRYGLGCDKCGDGVSYSEKFMHSLLEQLNVNFIHQVGKKYFDWCGNARYDFYLTDLNCIIEVHGMQHYFGKAHYGFKSFEYEQENDLCKKNMALNNGIVNYITIDCRKSTLEWIKKSVLNSELPNFLGFSESDIDWGKCQEYTSSSLVIEICNYKNNNPLLSTTQISEIYNIPSTTIQRYLQRGAELGICIYDKELEKFRAHKRAAKSRLKKSA